MKNIELNDIELLAVADAIKKEIKYLERLATTTKNPRTAIGAKQLIEVEKSLLAKLG